ncbi:hypothetical protein [Bartonella sp. MR168JLCBS]|uniref:hypothetical protein n=1 Tax=Bartonella sp. MR168JLCBS TaxID=3243556 RepID=UPI0035CF1DDB
MRYKAVKNKRVCWEEVTLWDSFVEERTYNIMLNAYSDELYLHRRMALVFFAIEFFIIDDEIGSFIGTLVMK